MVILNLALFKERNNPIQSLNDVFEYLNNTNSKQIILIDEIEKMVGKGEDSLTGRLMTILSDLNSKASEYKNLDVLIFATANSLSEILENQPALLRRGRFDELFFVNLPTMENAKEIFEIYIKKYNLSIINKLFDVDKIIIQIEDEYKEIMNQPRRFVYTASEIQTFLNRLHFIKIVNGTITQADIQENIKAVIPIFKTAQKGINMILGQKSLFVEI